MATRPGKTKSEIRNPKRIPQRPEPRAEGPETASAAEEMDPRAGGIPADNDKVRTNLRRRKSLVSQTLTTPLGRDRRARRAPGHELSALDHAAIRAQYRQSVERTMRDFNECTGNGPPGPRKTA